MKIPQKNRIVCTLLLICTLILDQWTKYLVSIASDLPYTLIPNFARITLHRNSGIAFSIPLPQPIIYVLIVVLIFFGGRYLLKEIDLSKPLTMIVLAFIFGGTLGNLIDRIRLGYVIDFISIWKFAVFNVADIAITCGIGILILWYSKLKNK